MNPTIRLALALLAGMAAAFITVALIETAGHALYPTPQGLNQNNPQALRAYIEALPLGAKLFVLVAWLAGTVDGVFVSCLVGRRRYGLCAAAIGTALLLATAANLWLIPHPLWLAAAGLLGIPATAYATARLCRRILPERPDADA